MRLLFVLVCVLTECTAHFPGDHIPKGECTVGQLLVATTATRSHFRSSSRKPHNKMSTSIELLLKFG